MELRVNGEPVDPALIEDAFQRLKAAAEERAEVSCCERDEEFVRQAEEEVINGVLLSQEAERRVPKLDEAEIRDGLEQKIREWRSHGASWDLIEHQRDTLRREVVTRLRMDRFTDSVWKEIQEPDEAELRAFYDEHRSELRRPARARVRHLMRFAETGDPAETYRLLCDLRHRVLDGADFAELAREHTEKHERETDLGWIEHERVLNPFEAMLFSLREGELSPVFSYERGLHLVRIEQLEPEHVPDFDDVTDRLRQRLLAEGRRAALEALARQLRQTAIIERLPDS